MDGSGLITAERVRAQARAFLAQVHAFIPTDRRLASWARLPANPEAARGLGGTPLLLVVGSRDQETPPAQARALYAALTTDAPEDTPVALRELDGLNHYFAELGGAPLAAAFGPISPRFVDLVAEVASRPVRSPPSPLKASTSRLAPARG